MRFVHRCDLNTRQVIMTKHLLIAFATPAAVEDRASTIRESFIEAGLILTETSGDVSYGGEAHLPGPLLTTAYRFDQRGPDLPPEILYWEYYSVQCRFYFWKVDQRLRINCLRKHNLPPMP